jgi:hypothetical protein
MKAVDELNKQLEKFIFRYGTHYIHWAEFGGQILFQNSRFAQIDTNINDLAEKAWQEIQSAFGSSTGGSGGVSVPIKFLTADLGGGLQKIETKNSAQGDRKEGYRKQSEMYALFLLDFSINILTNNK